MFESRCTQDKWTIEPFERCCTVLYGYPLDSTLFNEEQNGMPIIRVRDINSGFAGTYSTEKIDSIYIVHHGDLLISMDGDFCITRWKHKDALLNQRTCKIVCKSSIVDDYLIHYLQKVLNKIHSSTSSTTVKHLSAKEIDKIMIPVPPLDLQNQFADFVKQVDKSKLVFRKMVSKCNNLVDSRFKEIMTCDIPKTKYKLDDLIKQCTTFEKVEKTDDETYVTLQSKGRGAKKRTISEGKKPVAFTGYRIKTGQFMYSRIDARNGAFAIVPDELNNAVVSKDFPVFNINTDVVNPIFLLNYVTQDVFIDQIRSNSFGATNRQRIKEDTLLGYAVDLPPLAIQNQFADFVKHVDKLKFQQAS